MEKFKRFKVSYDEFGSVVIIRDMLSPLDASLIMSRLDAARLADQLASAVASPGRRAGEVDVEA